MLARADVAALTREIDEELGCQVVAEERAAALGCSMRRRQTSPAFACRLRSMRSMSKDRSHRKPRSRKRLVGRCRDAVAIASGAADARPCVAAGAIAKS